MRLGLGVVWRGVGAVLLVRVLGLLLLLLVWLL